MGYIIGVDFDGTVVTHMYPDIGKDIGAIPILKKIVEAGNKIILFTMRSNKNGTLKDAVKWFKDNGIELYGVNTNPTQSDWTDSPKAHCNIYIDDAALGIPTKFDEESGRDYVDWKKVEKLLEEKGVFDDFGEDEEFWKGVEMDGYDNKTNESIKMSRVKLTEQQLNTIITNSIKRILREFNGDDNYFIVFSDEWDGNISDTINPCYILKPEDINEQEGEVMVNGKPEFVITENTNFYADRNGVSFCQAGDLVFEVSGEYAFYRPGLNTPTSFVNADAIVGTEDEISNYMETYFE